MRQPQQNPATLGPSQAVLLYHAGRLAPQELAACFYLQGATLDGRLLELLSRGKGPHTLVRQPFAGKRVWVSKLPPLDAAPGDLWYDTLECTPTILLPALRILGGRVARPKGGGSGWLSLLPVRSWQLEVFLELARVRWAPALRLSVVLRHRRWATLLEGRYAGGLLHAEARAYAAWVGKSLQTQESQNALYLSLPLGLEEFLVGQGQGRWEEWTSCPRPGGLAGVEGGQSFLSLFPAATVEPDSFRPRRFLRTFLPLKRAARLRAGIRELERDQGSWLLSPAPRRGHPDAPGS